MRITIEVDGKNLLVTDVASQPGGVTPDALAHAEPPAELLAAAQARGAHSAGPAAFLQAAGIARGRPGELVAAAAREFVAAITVDTDLDAGRAAAAGPAEAASAPQRQAKTRRSRKER